MWGLHEEVQSEGLVGEISNTRPAAQEHAARNSAVGGAPPRGTIAYLRNPAPLRESQKHWREIRDARERKAPERKRLFRRHFILVFPSQTGYLSSSQQSE